MPLPSITPTTSGQAPNPLALQMQAIQRRQAIADAMQAQALQPQKAGQMVSGHYVSSALPNAVQKLVQILLSSKMSKDNLDEQGKVLEVDAAARQARIDKFKEDFAKDPRAAAMGGVGDPYVDDIAKAMIGKSLKDLVDYEVKGEPGGVQREIQYGPQGPVITTPEQPAAGIEQLPPIVSKGVTTRVERDKLSGETKYHNDPQPSASITVGSGAGVPPGDEFDPQTLRTAAIVVAADPAAMRQYASFGKIGQHYKMQINKEITKLKQETGMSDSDLIRARINAQAQRGSVQKMTAQRNAVQSYTDLAKANGEHLLDLFAKVDDTSVPIVEGILRISKSATGDVDAAELRSVLTAYQAETARILNNPTMAGVVSDTARKEVAEMARGDMSVAQAQRVIRRISTEFDLRLAGMDSMLEHSLDQSVVLGQEPAAAPSPSTSSWSIKPVP